MSPKSIHRRIRRTLHIRIVQCSAEGALWCWSILISTNAENKLLSVLGVKCAANFNFLKKCIQAIRGLRRVTEIVTYLPTSGITLALTLNGFLKLPFFAHQDTKWIMEKLRQHIVGHCTFLHLAHLFSYWNCRSLLLDAGWNLCDQKLENPTPVTNKKPRKILPPVSVQKIPILNKCSLSTMFYFFETYEKVLTG